MTQPATGRHQATGHWRLGLLFSLITMLAWATLPIALKVALDYLDPVTLTWFRFLVAAVVLAAWLSLGQGLRDYPGRLRKAWPLLLLAAAMLTGNYVLYLLGLGRTSPANAQVLIQLAPMLMAMGGLVVFGEHYNRAQWLGFFTLIGGLVVFFRNQLLNLAHDADTYMLGVGFMVLAAIAWATYALTQKQLMRDFTSRQILLFIYIFAAITLLPASAPAALAELGGEQWLWVLYCALNTLIAYGAFGEAMQHWEASRVSTVLALTPLGTIGVATLVAAYWPGLIAPERLDLVSIGGAVLVVAGSATTSLAGRPRRRAAPAEPAVVTAPRRRGS